VNLSKHPFRLNVGFLLAQPVGTSHTFPFEFEEIQISEDLDLRHFQGEAIFNRTPQGLLVQGKFHAILSLECARCLEPYDHLLEWEMTELYAFRRKAAENDLILPEDAQIDIQPLVREYALLEIPMNPICSPDCKGLCPICGVNLNKTQCNHQTQTEDSPFAVLKALLED
jgi:uncharacterized protein